MLAIIMFTADCEDSGKKELYRIVEFIGILFMQDFVDKNKTLFIRHNFDS